MNILEQKALEYAVRGYSVMPLRIDKKPLLPSWKQFQTAAADEQQIAAWWAKNPKANIGIITGKISGITVIDIDTSDPKSTVPLSAFPPTLTIKTPTGGYHLYYEYAGSIQQTANSFPQFPHVDIRNDGGFVVAPPSHCEYEKDKKKVSGDYTVFKKLKPAPFPTNLFAKQAAPKKALDARDVLKGFPELAEGDGRNNALAKVVGRLLRLTLPQDFESVAWPIALAANKQFKKPLDEKEVRTLFNSIAKKEARKPLKEVEFLTTDKGQIIANTENVYRTLIHDDTTVGMFRLNTFTGSVECRYGRGEEEWTSFQRIDVIKVRNYLMSTYAHFTKIPHGEVEDAMLRVAEDNRLSPPADWVRSLTWDKKARLDTWMCHTFGVEDNKYHRAVASNWIKGLIKRVTHPGCKFDYVLVLEGKQGIGKSTALGILGGDWHLETVFAPNNKDFFQLLSGNLIVEFSEGETLSRTEAKLLKAVITMQFDKYRPPYERSVKNFPRQCVFAMTTNQEQYLKDETGNRRWLPVAVRQEIDNDWLRKNREQIFAEAYHRVITMRETTYEFPKEETEIEQNARQISDPNEDVVADWYWNNIDKRIRGAGISIHQVFHGALHPHFAGKAVDRRTEMEIANILRRMGLVKERRYKNGVQSTFWFHPKVERLSEEEMPREASLSDFD